MPRSNHEIRCASSRAQLDVKVFEGQDPSVGGIAFEWSSERHRDPDTARAMGKDGHAARFHGPISGARGGEVGNLVDGFASGQRLLLCYPPQSLHARPPRLIASDREIQMQFTVQRLAAMHPSW